MTMPDSRRHRPPRNRLAAALIIAALVALSCKPTAGGTQTMTPFYSQNTRAPEFPRGLDWLNTSKPLTLAQLRGKVVLLDFWTYCCINCMHVLPKLDELEKKYADSLVVIGVHSAKFKDEGETANIRQAILRYNIDHPVVNDRDFKIWNAYSARAWPTMVLIDPDGYIVGSNAGEGAPEFFDPMIEKLLQDFKKQGKLNTTPLNLVLERSSAPPSLLEFPGKVMVDSTGGRLFITDSNHNRVVVTRLKDGMVLDVIGSGMQGMDDGSFENATFNHPQGLALDGDTLYIADTENHTIRAADLKQRKVTLVAGTGKQGGYGFGSGKALKTAISSPWGLVWVKGRLYIAMAGTHQLWYYDPGTQEIGVWAGSGQENISDGSLKWSNLAQPSGITTDGKRLFFADSEVSAIRSAELDPNGLVNTIVGQGLFVFGDVDGKGTDVRLQHPLGISWHDGLLYVADTYNNKIKAVDPVAKTSRTLAGNGDEGYRDGNLTSAQFNEPGGLSVAPDGRIYVADTNNNLVRVVDPAADTVGNYMLKGIDKLMPGEEGPKTEALTTGARIVAPGSGSLVLNLAFPKGYKLNREGGIRVTVSSSSEKIAQVQREVTATDSLPITVPIQFISGTTEINVDMQFAYCTEGNEGLCYFGSGSVIIPVRVDPAHASGPLSYTYTVIHQQP